MSTDRLWSIRSGNRVLDAELVSDRGELKLQIFHNRVLVYMRRWVSRELALQAAEILKDHYLRSGGILIPHVSADSDSDPSDPD